MTENDGTPLQIFTEERGWLTLMIGIFLVGVVYGVSQGIITLFTNIAATVAKL